MHVMHVKIAYLHHVTFYNRRIFVQMSLFTLTVKMGESESELFLTQSKLYEQNVDEQTICEQTGKFN